VGVALKWIAWALLFLATCVFVVSVIEAFHGGTGEGLLLAAAALALGGGGGWTMREGCRRELAAETERAGAVAPRDLGKEFDGLSEGGLDRMRRDLEASGAEGLSEIAHRSARGRYAHVLPGCGHVCFSCGQEARSRYFEFYETVGMLVARTYRTAKGPMCGRCMTRTFGTFTAKTLFLGWWSYTSLFMTVAILPGNLAWFLTGLGLPSPPGGARPLGLAVEDVRGLGPHVGAMVADLRGGPALAAVASDYARRAGTTPARTVLYLLALATEGRRMKRDADPGTGDAGAEA